ncbi:MAG: hypothetical protein WC441_05395 [Patescibacteria group bacterium]
MLKLSEQELSQLRQLRYSPQWQTLERVAELFSESIQKGKVAKRTEWNFIQGVLEKEGRIQGIKDFLEEINKLSENE